MKWLIALGLIINLIGTLKLYLSVKPSKSNLIGEYENKGMKIYSMAVMDEHLSKEGIRIIAYGFIAQLLAVILPL